ncbi:MAG: hypothetical protein ACLQMF_20105 [Rectinemataceae bacterium]
MDEGKRIVEINGVKVEVDLRTAKIVESYKIGDSVKLLKKRYSDYEVLPAAIVGFTEFQALPTIELVAVDHSGNVEFFAWNEKTEGMEIAPFNKYELAFDRANIMEKLDSAVNAKSEELRVAVSKRQAFIETFARVFDLVPEGEER